MSDRPPFQAEHVRMEIVRLRIVRPAGEVFLVLDIEEAEELYRELRRLLLDAGRRPPLP